MSDKDRQKKDHMRTDKKKKAMREHENTRTGDKPPQQAKDQSNLGNADKRG